MGGGATATKVVYLFAANLFVLNILQANAASDDDLVHQWCQRTENNSLCVSIIEADPRTNLKNSPNGFCAILRDRAVADAVATSRKIPEFLNSTTNRYGIQCLQDCADEYQRAITILKSVDFTVINRKTYLSMAVDVANGYNGPQDCEYCFTERPGTSPSPLTSDNQNISDISIAIVTIINLVVCHKVEACVG